MSAERALAALGDAIGPLDRAFARLMLRLDGRDSGAVAAAAALASAAVSQGHVCLDLGAEPGLPPLPALRGELGASPVVAAPGGFAPLVLDGRERLYLWRYWDYERRVAQTLESLAGGAEPAPDAARLAAALERLFPPSPQVPDWQKVAAAVALTRRLAVISGGPGTGKTTTVARILALLAMLSPRRPPRVALAAPTGKAAGRMQEALVQARARLGLDAAVAAAIPEQAQTLHRLLGARADGSGFRHGPDDPLRLDVLVVDEASMVDLALMAQLLSALPPHARLILLGDRDQLASVEAGAVLGDICAGSGFSPAFAARLGELAGAPVPAGGGAGPLADAIVLLRHSYRFPPESGIGRLARLVNAGDADGALALLAAPEPADLGWQPGGAARFVARVAEGYRDFLEGVQAGVGPEEAFARFGRFRALTAHRAGAAGAEAVNRALEQMLPAARGRAARERWYPGRPVLVSRNDYAAGLYNGDLGIALDLPGRGLTVCFEGDQGMRLFAPARVPEHETAFAMTVHKAQGSEFDCCALLLPDTPSAATNRPLLYTAVTRARARVELWGPDAVIRHAVATPVRRSSGLREALWGGG